MGQVAVLSLATDRKSHHESRGWAGVVVLACLAHSPGTSVAATIRQMLGVSSGRYLGNMDKGRRHLEEEVVVLA